MRASAINEPRRGLSSDKPVLTVSVTFAAFIEGERPSLRHIWVNFDGEPSNDLDDLPDLEAYSVLGFETVSYDTFNS